MYKDGTHSRLTVDLLIASGIVDEPASMYFNSTYSNSMYSNSSNSTHPNSTHSILPLRVGQHVLRPYALQPIVTHFHTELPVCIVF